MMEVIVRLHKCWQEPSENSCCHGLSLSTGQSMQCSETHSACSEGCFCSVFVSLIGVRSALKCPVTALCCIYHLLLMSQEWTWKIIPIWCFVWIVHTWCLPFTEPKTIRALSSCYATRFIPNYRPCLQSFPTITTMITTNNNAITLAPFLASYIERFLTT